MGRWTLAALMINSVIGSGIFGVPANVDGLVGTAAPLAYVVAAAGVALIMASFAEVGSQFRESGGVYLCARAAFGRFAGIQMGWMALMVRVSAHAAIANLLVVYLAEFVPGILATVPRAAVIVGVLGVLAGINVIGIRQGALVSTLFAVGKVTPLVAFAVVGLVMAGDQVPAPAFGAGAPAWGRAVLVLMFAFGGFESALLPMGEARNPRRDVPVALAAGLVACAVIYVGVHLVVMATLPDPSASSRPLSDAAGVMFGPAGADLMAVAAVVSILGILGAGMVNTPRLFFALADGGDFPSVLGRVHARYRTPHVALLVYTTAVCVLALGGTFIWNAVLSAAGRMLTYALVCAALLKLRHTEPGADAFRVPAGRLVALCGLLFSAVLVAQMGRGEFMVIVATVAIALANWMWVIRARAQRDKAPVPPGRSRRGPARVIRAAIVVVCLGAMFVMAVWSRWAALTGAGPATVALARLFRHGPTTVDDFRVYPARRLARSPAPRSFDDRRGSLRSSATIDAGNADSVPWLEFTTRRDTLAMLIVHGDAIVYEHYADGFTATSPSQYFSVTKSVTSLLVGMAIDDGVLPAVDAPLTTQVPELADRGFDAVTPALLLTMCSGLDYRENDNPFGKHIALNYTSDLERMVLGFRLGAPPGTVHDYKSGDTALLSVALSRALAPESITAYARRRLWVPLGAEDDAVWTVDREGGLEKAWCCLAGSARDLAKIGRLMLSHGAVNGRSLISAAWVARSTSVDTLTPGLWPSDFTRVGIRGYGYGWWLATADDGDYFAQGKDGQFLYVNPAHDVIVVRLGRGTSETPTSRWIGLFRQLARDVAP